MMHKSPLMKAVGKAAWAVTALVAVSVGLTPFGWNVMHGAFFVTKLAFMYYVILLAGLVSFGMFCMACSGGCCSSQN